MLFKIKPLNIPICGGVMDVNSNGLFKHIAVSVALPEIFYNFRVFSKNKVFCEIQNVSKSNDSKYCINGWEIDDWQFERMVKIYTKLFETHNMKISFDELLERLDKGHFDNVDIFAKKVYDLIIQKYITLLDFYDEENYLCIDLEKFYFNNEIDWNKLKEVVSMVTVILDNLLTTYLISPSSRNIKINVVGLDKLNLDDETMNKIKEYIKYYSYVASLKLSKEREIDSIFRSIDFSENSNELNWAVLLTDVKLYGLRNEITFSFCDFTEEEVECEVEVEDSEENSCYYSGPVCELIDEDKMAPLVKGIKGIKEMCPVCASKNIIYEAGCMCCLSCGWSACSLC